MPEPEAARVPMSTHRMRCLLSDIGWSQRELARQLNTNEVTIHDMARGRRAIPFNLADWLEGLAACHRAAGKPKGWRSTEIPEELSTFTE